MRLYYKNSDKIYRLIKDLGINFMGVYHETICNVKNYMAPIDLNIPGLTDPEDIFRYTNIDPEFTGRSLSVGDVLYDKEKNLCYHIDTFGFTPFSSDLFFNRQ